MSVPENGPTLTYRVGQLERDLERFEERYERRHTELVAQVVRLQEQIAVLRAEFHGYVASVDRRLDELEANLTNDIKDYNEDVKGLKKVLILSLTGVMGAAITFAITSLAVYGGPG